MKPFRVRFWQQDEDGREEHMEFNSLEQAKEFYHSMDGMAELKEE